MAIVNAESTFVHLLDIDPELAWRLREDDRLEAREYLRLPLTTVPVGAWSLASSGRQGRPFGMIVVDGVLLQEVQIAGRHALQVLGPGDVVLPKRAPGDGLKVRMSWMATVESRIAVLDDHLQAPLALWPGLALALIERAGEQLSRTAIQAAIGQLPRVDQRLEATFWHLADRWGRVTPSGIHVPLTLTHEVLARLVGGQRPTITLALTELADRGVVVRHPDRTWLITAHETTLPKNDLDDHVPTLEAKPRAAEPPPMRTPMWSADAGRALVADVEQLRDAHEARRRQLQSDLERYAATRERSASLRRAIAGRRGAD